MRVLFVTNIPTPYRIRFFNLLGKHVDLHVIYEAEEAKNIVFSFKDVHANNFKFSFLKKGYIHERIPNLRIISHILRNDYNVLILTNYAYMTELIAYITAILFKKKFIIEEDGNKIKLDESKALYLLKKWLISNASLYLSPSKKTDQFFIHYGAEKWLIHRYPFTSVSIADIPTKIFSRNSDSSEIRYLYVGRIIPLKGVDNLIFAFNKASQVNSNIRLSIIGNAPDPAYLAKLQNSASTKIDFRAFMDSKELQNEYLNSDVFVFPTRYDPWGLVINEAISYGLPVISSNESMSAQELIVNGQNGFLYDPEDVERLSELILYIADNKKLREEISINNHKLARMNTIEKMVDVHLEVFKKVYNHE